MNENQVFLPSEEIENIVNNCRPLAHEFLSGSLRISLSTRNAASSNNFALLAHHQLSLRFASDAAPEETECFT